MATELHALFRASNAPKSHFFREKERVSRLNLTFTSPRIHHSIRDNLRTLGWDVKIELDRVGFQLLVVRVLLIN